MKRLPILFSAVLLLAATAPIFSAAYAIPATSADGRVLNLGFEDGTELKTYESRKTPNCCTSPRCPQSCGARGKLMG